MTRVISYLLSGIRPQSIWTFIDIHIYIYNGTNMDIYERCMDISNLGITNPTNPIPLYIVLMGIYGDTIKNMGYLMR
jgi:hypothetical protein